MIPKNDAGLKDRVVASAEAALAAQHYVSPIDILVGLRWLAPTHIEHWRQGRVPYLQQVLQVNPEKIARSIEILREWAEQLGLRPEETTYLARTVRSRRELRFSAGGDPELEKYFRTHFFEPTVPEKKREKLREKLSQRPEIVVFWILRESQCAQCETNLPKGSSLVMEGDQPLCRACADLDHLVYLERGDAALTRRARKYSSLAAVVVRFSRSRNRYERQGILVEEDALLRAEQECALDEAQRAQRREREAHAQRGQDQELVARMAAKILDLFPGCPVAEADKIAQHAAVRGSGRIGRSAAGRALDEGALRLAVIASIRHRHTNYDELLMQGVDRASARETVREQTERVLAAWQGTPQ